jgi:hypothetical protein
VVREPDGTAHVVHDVVEADLHRGRVLAARSTLVARLKDIENSVRGLLRGFGRPRPQAGGVLHWMWVDGSEFRFGTPAQRNFVCGAIVKPQEASYGSQEGYTGRAAFGT